MRNDIRDRLSSRLLALYRQYIGEPEHVRDVYLGFGLFFAGIAFAVVGVLVFLWSSAYPQTVDRFWQLREIAIVLAAIGLPTFLASVTVLLPVDRRAEYATVVGGAICLLAVAMFVAAYPHNWNVSGPDASVRGVGTYSLGLVVLVGSIGSALVTNYIQHTSADVAAAAGTAGDGSTAEAGSDGTETETISEGQVARDIEDAMTDAELSWGGVEKSNTKRITFQTDDAESEIDRSSFDRVGANESRTAGGVDDAVDSLQQFRGGDTARATGQGTDQQADALSQLRERQAAEEQQAEKRGLSDRLRERLGL